MCSNSDYPTWNITVTNAAIYRVWGFLGFCVIACALALAAPPPKPPFEMPELVAPTFPDHTVDIRQHGAIAGGEIMNTTAIANAIAACADAGGGRVVVPEGVWLTGPIHLRSNINLHFEAGAEVRFSTDFSHYLPVVFTRWEGFEIYNYSSFIYARDCTNIAITGAGKLDGQGKIWWPWKHAHRASGQRVYEMVCKNVPVKERVFGTEKDSLRPSFIQTVSCRNVLIEGITLGSGPMWTIHPIYSENVIVRGVTVVTSGPNNDGINPDSCRNVLIEDCYFDTGDDCIVLKSGMNEGGWRVGKPCENIIIRYCRTRRGHGGVVIGSDTSGGVRNVFAHDCQFDGTDQGIRMKSMRGRGGVVENIWIQDIDMGRIRGNAIIMNMFYRSSTVKPATKKPPKFRNIHIKNITCRQAGRAVNLIGLPEQNLENVTLENITIAAKYGLKCTDATSVKLINVNVTPQKGPVVELVDCRDVTIRNASCAVGADTYLHLRGRKTNGVQLLNCDLSNAKQQVKRDKEIKPDAVRFNGEDLNVLSGKKNALLYDYLQGEAEVMFDARHKEMERALASPRALAARQKLLRESYRRVIGYLPHKTPLNATTTGSIEGDGYRIENVVYESRPNHHVTANFYLPTTGKGPYPGIIVPCGHAKSGKVGYQLVGVLMAKNGLVALIVDPICQGERFQILDDKGKPKTRGGTTTHVLLDVGSKLVGASVVGYEAWDNMRGIDYLCSRTEVDTTRIGCTGNSGGGTQTKFLMALDERIKAAGPSCAISSLQYDFKRSGGQCGCQNLSSEIVLGLEHADYFAMFAPRPVLILAADRDHMFGIDEARKTLREVKRVYSVLGVADRADLFSYDDKHGWSKPRREAAVRWMCRWLLNDNAPIIELDQKPYEEQQLWASKTGQVVASCKNGVTVTDLNIKRAKELAPQREKFWKENSKQECLAEVQRMIGMRSELAKPTIENVGSIYRDDCHIEKLIIQRPGEVPVPGLLFVPKAAKGRSPATLYVDGRGKLMDALPGGIVARLVESGRIVLSIDVRGRGESADDQARNNRKHWNDEIRSAYLSMQMGRPLMGQRVEDVLVGLEALLDRDDVDADKIGVVGIGRTGPVVLHAAALDERFASVSLRHSITSWIDVVSAPLAPNQIGSVIPFALTRYDLPDLVEVISPRPVEIDEPVDAFGKRK
jgi:cephalosporin-C deacetylase-like acetyl esterase